MRCLTYSTRWRVGSIRFRFLMLVSVAATLGCDVDDARRRLEALEADEYVRTGAWSDAPSMFGYFLTQKGRDALTDAVWD